MKESGINKYRLLWVQIVAATRASLLSRYRSSMIGVLWVILSPIIIFGAQSYAFRYILNLQIERFFLFLLSGLLPWFFIFQTVDMCTTVIINMSRVTRAYPISPIVFLSAQVLDNFVNFLLSMIFILFAVSFIETIPALSLVMVPVAIVPLLIGVFAISLLAGTANVFYRDLKFVITFAFSVGFFLTPIFYPEHFIPEQYRWVSEYNPIYTLIRPIRESLTSIDGLPVAYNLMKSYLLSLSLLILSMFYWGKQRTKVHLNA